MTAAGAGQFSAWLPRRRGDPRSSTFSSAPRLFSTRATALVTRRSALGSRMVGALGPDGILSGMTTATSPSTTLPGHKLVADVDNLAVLRHRVQ